MYLSSLESFAKLKKLFDICTQEEFGFIIAKLCVYIRTSVQKKNCWGRKKITNWVKKKILDKKRFGFKIFV